MGLGFRVPVKAYVGIPSSGRGSSYVITQGPAQ